MRNKIQMIMDRGNAIHNIVNSITERLNGCVIENGFFDIEGKQRSPGVYQEYGSYSNLNDAVSDIIDNECDTINIFTVEGVTTYASGTWMTNEKFELTMPVEVVESPEDYNYIFIS